VKVVSHITDKEGTPRTVIKLSPQTSIVLHDNVAEYMLRRAFHSHRTEEARIQVVVASELGCIFDDVYIESEKYPCLSMDLTKDN